MHNTAADDMSERSLKHTWKSARVRQVVRGVLPMIVPLERICAIGWVCRVQISAVIVIGHGRVETACQH